MKPRAIGSGPGRTKTAVDRIGRGKARQVNMRFLAMTNPYVFEPQFGNPASGWVEPACRQRFETAGEGGQVGKNVQDSRHRRWQPMPKFPDPAALNAWLEQRCVDLWRDIPHGVRPGTIAGVWAVEQAALRNRRR